MGLILEYKAVNCDEHSGEESLRELHWPELIWSAVTVGKRDSKFWGNYAPFSVHDYLFRLELIRLSLMEREGVLCKTPLYAEGLDPSEKTAISYFLGLTAAKLFAWRFFKVPWLMHLDLCTDLDIVWRDNNRRIRPDLVGKKQIVEQCQDEKWIVMEAKGRSSGFKRETLEQALRQTEQILSINSHKPQNRVALQAYFQRNGQDEQWKVYLQDPDEADENALHVKINLKRFFCEYYYHIVNILVNRGIDTDDRSQSRDSLDNDTFFTLKIKQSNYRMRRFRSIGVDIGLSERILNYYLTDFIESSETDVMMFFDNETAKLECGGNEARFIGPDGIVVQVGKEWMNWHAELQRLIIQNGLGKQRWPCHHFRK